MGLKPIVVVGSINTDLVSLTERIPLAGETVLGSDFKIYPGGKGANQAVAIARLGYPVRMIGRVGTDSFGRDALQHLKSAGVDAELVGTSDGSSGIAVICVSAKGENSIIVTPGANATLTPPDVDEHISVIRGASAVLAQLEIPIETVEHLGELCAQEGVPFLLDPAPAAVLPGRLFSRITWFTPNQMEAAFYANGKADGTQFKSSSIADELLRKGVHGVVLKMGADGVSVFTNERDLESIPAYAVQAVDTTAAGDAFNGGFAVGLAKGMSPIESARFASAVAGISVTRRGAQSSMPTIQEVEEFLVQQTSGAV
ncbi:ribokinase [Terracidiphilus gabretensis]|uniref:ribokinase n=1 Tax=Terracidiphilus gabretensis TaxID=1577687 RepID=UPI000A422D47|nr:ribokinase [Terracidiphilus gabretensis]